MQCNTALLTYRCFGGLTVRSLRISIRFPVSLLVMLAFVCILTIRHLALLLSNSLWGGNILDRCVWTARVCRSYSALRQFQRC
jgi:hypothetical protein